MLANSKKSANFALAKGPSGGMVDAHVSGACAARREGSSPFLGTFFKARSTAHLHHVQCLVFLAPPKKSVALTRQAANAPTFPPLW